MPKGPPTPDAQEQAALSDAVRAVLAPAARLALARGVTFATLAELFSRWSCRSPTMRIRICCRIAR